MTLLYTAATAKEVADYTVDRLDVGAGTPSIAFYTAANELIVSFTLDGTAAFGDCTSACPSVCTLTGLPISATAETFSGTRTVNYARYNNSDGTEKWRVTSANIGIVGSGEPIEITALAVSSGQPLQLTACTHSQPCGS